VHRLPPIQAELRKQPGVDGIYATHRMACAIPLSIQAELREQPGDLSGAAQAAR